jgi:endonuclease/exonuclease/phosphatase family metal-dependent hydrolase
MIGIVVRELMTIWASIDTARGMPIIHLNYLGYDKAAHYRGPHSALAHWSLKGINLSIQRVFDASRRSARRDYTLWVYSDHGQDQVTPYVSLHGQTIQQAVADVVRTVQAARLVSRGDDDQATSDSNKNASHIGNAAAPTHRPHESMNATESTRPLVVAGGPLGHIYLPPHFSVEDRDEVARMLATEAYVPLVLVADGVSAAKAWDSKKAYRIPQDSAEVLGEDHPFSAEVAHDLAQVCHHPDSGDIVISGWRRGQQPVSFVLEYGAHGGPSPDETHGFALLPPDTPLQNVERDYIRPMDLRWAALHFLDRADIKPEPRRRQRLTQKDALRIVTYNVHSCIGLDNKLSMSRIFRLLKQIDADVVALQELDVRQARSDHVDQAEELARRLEMSCHFHPAMATSFERYGDAILSRLPMSIVKAACLPPLDSRPTREPRGAIWVRVDVNGCEVQILNTHLGLSRKEHSHQVQALLGPDWLGHSDCKDPVVLCGDFNFGPRSMPYRLLQARMRDAQKMSPGHRVRNTWSSRYPLLRIDHVFVSQGIEIVSAKIPSNQLSRVASDHLPLVVDLRLSAMFRKANRRLVHREG